MKIWLRTAFKRHSIPPSQFMFSRRLTTVGTGQSWAWILCHRTPSWPCSWPCSMSMDYLATCLATMIRSTIRKSVFETIARRFKTFPGPPPPFFFFGAFFSGGKTVGRAAFHAAHVVCLQLKNSAVAFVWSDRSSFAMEKRQVRSALVGLPGPLPPDTI